MRRWRRRALGSGRLRARALLPPSGPKPAATLVPLFSTAAGFGTYMETLPNQLKPLRDLGLFRLLFKQRDGSHAVGVSERHGARNPMPHCHPRSMPSVFNAFETWPSP